MQQETIQNKQKRQNKKYLFQKCQVHRNATSFGEPLNKQMTCQCCSKSINKKSINYNFQMEQLFYLGTTIPEYFLNIKISLGIIGMLCVVYGIPMLIINYINNNCQNSISLGCSSLFFTRFSLINSFSSDSSFLIQTILISLGVITSLIIAIFGKYLIEKLRINCRQKYCFQHHFAAFVRFQDNNLNQKYIQQCLESWWKDQISQHQNLRSILKQFYPFYEEEQINQLVELQLSQKIMPNNQKSYLLQFLAGSLIKKIIFCYNTQKFKQVSQKILILQKKTKKIQQINSHRQLKNKQIQALKEFLEELNNLKSEKNLSKYLQLTNKCIIIFRFQPISKYFVKKHHTKLCENKKHIKSLMLKSIQQAPAASQINWQNHHLLLSQHKLRPRIYSCLFFIFLIVLTFGVLFGFLILYHNLLQSNSSFIQQFFSFLLALTILIINFFCKSLINWAIENQKRPFKSQSYKTQIWRLFSIQFLTQGFFLAFFYCIVDVNYIQKSNGFLDTIFYLLMLHCLDPFIKFINLGMILQQITQYMIQYKQNGQMSQKQANQAFEKQQFQLVNSNVKLIHMLVWCCFIGPLCPFSTVFGFLSLFFQYLSQKLYLIKFCRQPKINLSDQFNNYVYKFICFSPFFTNLGNLFCLLLRIYVEKELNKSSIQVIISLTVLVISLLSIIYLNQNHEFSFKKYITKQKNKQIQNYQNRNQHDILQSNRQNHFKLLLKNQKKQNIKTFTFQKEKITQNLYIKVYQQIFLRFTQKYQSFCPIPQQYLLKSGTKHISASYRQKMQIIQQLNTMSKTLEQSLKDKLFNENRKSAILTPRITLRKAQPIDENIYYQYQKKVQMQKPVLRVKIPPLYKRTQQPPGSKNLSIEYQLCKSKSASSLHHSSKRQQKIDQIQEQGQSQQLKRISSLFGEDQQHLKTIVKNKIKHSIKKINN